MDNFPAGLNDTSITLIFKKKSLENMGDIRPISLYNVLYKIITKVLANKMKVVSPHVVSESQYAFV